ncbi:MAG: polyphosphate polymerase domain-containing protein [Calditrichae bacterium]|nr:polyphosphate polymerase domain-containing protein [Calditrichota bacterium]MCB9057889.1 polyphosphate polymerase domain-containing protein [Calditrichia bacterium]
MLTKIEYKFLVPESKLDNLRSDLTPFTELDKYSEIDDRKEYTVRSIYYDTPGFECYVEKKEGLKIRKKYRLRGYNEEHPDNVLFLEIKRKNKNYIRKNRAPFLYKNINSVLFKNKLAGNILSNGNGKEMADAKRFFYNYHTKALRPVVLIIYEREAFFSKFDPTLRLTFDKNLRSVMYPLKDDVYSAKKAKYAMPGFFIFEVKFVAGMPLWVTNIIQKYGLSRQAISKYTITIDSHKRKMPKFNIINDFRL